MKKNSPNRWLEDQAWLLQHKGENVDFYYLRRCCQKVLQLVRRAPVPIITDWDETRGRIKVWVGSSSRFFPVGDYNMTPDTFAQSIGRWVEQFYPQYDLQIETKRSLTREEIYHGFLADEFTLDEGMSRKVTETHQEIGKVLQVWMKQDEFLFRKGTVMTDPHEIRLSTKPLSWLLDDLQKAMQEGDGESIRRHILDHSRFLREPKLKQQRISPPGVQLLNWFILMRPTLLKLESTKTEVGSRPAIDFGGVFLVIFESEAHQADCLHILVNGNDTMSFLESEGGF